MDSESKYHMFSPIGNEFAFDVDLSKLPVSAAVETRKARARFEG